MKLLSIDALKTLAEERSDPSVSIFLPTHRAGPDTQQDPIRLKNLLQEAEERLLAGGLRRPVAQKLLRPASALQGDSAFWRHQSDGLALFLSAQTSHVHCLPLFFDELLVVADRFYLKPLLPLFTDDGHFFILAISQSDIRLLEATRYSVDELEVEGAPKGLADVLRDSGVEPQLQFHTRASGGPDGRPAAFHGHGGLTDGAKDRIRRYFRLVDRSVWDLLRQERAPLVLAGVEYLFPLYRDVNSYPHLLDEGIAGNPEELSPQALHERAWEVVQPRFTKALEEALARYRQLAGSDQVSADLAETVSAAHSGRVDTLFVAAGVQRWGAFDPDSYRLRLAQEAGPGSEDLLNLAAVKTIVNGGVVYVVAPEAVPDRGLLAAIFRY